MLKTFILIFLCSWSRAGVFGVDVKMEVTEGESVTLNPDLTELQRNEQIMWKFGDTNILIAKINRQNNRSVFYNDSADGRFRDRLKLDQTGSLTIINSRTTDSGLYTVFSSRRDTINMFNLTVY
ncbi:hypothetical protein ABG768_020646, partial [Culter alburnus]